MIRVKKTIEEEYINLNSMMKTNNYIGFEDSAGDRYMIVRSGPGKGLAVNSMETWANKEDQNTITEGYKIFSSREELLEWMKG